MNFEIEHKTKYSIKQQRNTTGTSIDDSKIIMIFELLKCNEGAVNKLN